MLIFSFPDFFVRKLCCVVKRFYWCRPLFSELLMSKSGVRQEIQISIGNHLRAPEQLSVIIAHSRDFREISMNSPK